MYTLHEALAGSKCGRLGGSPSGTASPARWPPPVAGAGWRRSPTPRTPRHARAAAESAEALAHGWAS